MDRFLGKLHKNFSSALVLGFVFIGLSIALDVSVVANPYFDDLLKKYTSLRFLNSTLQNIGIAFIVGHYFSLLMSTKEFLNIIQERLIEIIVSCEFIKFFDETRKKDIAKKLIFSILKVDKSSSIINNYIDSRIEAELESFVFSFKDKSIVDVIASIDKATGLVKFSICVEYKLHRAAHELTQLSYESTATLTHVKTVVRDPKGNSYSIPSDCDNEECSKDKSRISYTFPQKFLHAEYVDVRRNFIELAKDHWGVFTYKSINPMNGVRIKLFCADDLAVKEVITDGLSKTVKIDPENYICTKEVVVDENQWVPPGFGVSILVAKNNSY